MNTEYEATFIDIDVNKIKERLLALNANLIKPETLLRRIVFQPPSQIEGGWMRVRDEGDKIALSLKVVNGRVIDDQKEIELKIDDFDQGVALLEAVGAKKKAFQETKREKWLYKECDITIDTWPGLEPFIEIESTKSEDNVRAIAKDLNLDYSQAIFGSVDVIYQKKLGIPCEVINNKTPELTFANPPKLVERIK